jgi:hypothetical protein
MSGAAAMTERKPERDKNGLPWCTRDDCPQYDGKRCREMGSRPDTFCEPQLIDDYAARIQPGSEVSLQAAPVPASSAPEPENKALRRKPA